MALTTEQILGQISNDYKIKKIEQIIYSKLDVIDEEQCDHSVYNNIEVDVFSFCGEYREIHRTTLWNKEI